jgi:ferric-dicitrate binding protein FerR (iron transport regulator)
MSKEEAIKILEQALNAANLKGVFSLPDVQMILNALNALKEN